MKKVFTVGALALAFVFFSTSCEEVKDLTVLEIDTGIEATATIDIQDSGDIAYTATEVIPVSANQDLAEYRDQLKSVNVTTLQYKVSNYTGADDGAFEGTMKFDAIPSIVLEMPRTEVKSAQENDVTTTIVTTQEELDQISALFRDGQDVSITMEGTAYNAPMNFDLKLIVTVKAQAELEL